jgi:hypothetical protein
MDAKEKRKIAGLHAAIVKGEFTEDDVCLLLILLRDHSAGTEVRELGDFVAHRTRTMGTVHAYIKKIKAVITARSGTLNVEPVFRCTQFGECLNNTLAKFELPPIATDRMNDVVICIISLLQFAELRELGVLNVAVTKDTIELDGTFPVPAAAGKTTLLMFPVLEAANTWFPYKGTHGVFTDVIWAECKAGKISIT